MDCRYCALAGDVLSRLSKQLETSSQPLLVQIARTQIVSVCVFCLVGLLVCLAGFRFQRPSQKLFPREGAGQVCFLRCLTKIFFACDRGTTNRCICLSEAEPEVGPWPPLPQCG